MAHFSAKNARVTVNGTAVKAKKWSVEAKNEALDVTSFESSGFGEYIAGVYDADITIEFDYDYTSTTSTYDLLPLGTLVTNLLLYSPSSTSASGGAASGSQLWTFASALVVDNTGAAGVRETITGTIKLKASGTFSVPT